MTRPSRSLFVACFLFGSALWVHAANLTPDSAKVFRSARGEEVTVVLLKQPAEHQAVIQVTGTASPLDGLALPYKRSNNGRHESYSTQWRGRTFSFVQMNESRGERWELYVPGDLRQSHALSYDDGRTKSANPAAIVALHEKQRQDGTLTRFAAFNRSEEQKEQEKTLSEAVAAADKACGSKLKAQVAWPTISDEVIKQYSVGSFCSTPIEAMTTLCKGSEVAATFLRDKVKEVSCSWTAPMKLALNGSKLELSVDPQFGNQDDFAKKQLEAIEVAAPLAKTAGEAPPWGEGRTLGQRTVLAKTHVCSDGKNHYVAHVKDSPSGAQMFYGDGKKLTAVPLSIDLGDSTFFEPRYENPTANPSFRGYDVRLQSSVDFDAAKGTCSLRCGTQRREMQVLPAAAATQLLTAASFQAAPPLHVPHALARDERGNYYLVDKGSTAATANSYRLFMGQKGNLKLQKMTNVVSDSQGEIFSTKTGDLRLIVGPGGTQSTWVKGQSRTNLLAVPIAENLKMIWTELGVYAGERRGSPCDDL